MDFFQNFTTLITAVEDTGTFIREKRDLEDQVSF